MFGVVRAPRKPAAICMATQVSPEENSDLQLHWAPGLHSHRAATRAPKGWKGVGEVRKSCDGGTERKNRESRQNNLYFVTSASCSYIGQQVSADNFLEQVSWLNSSRCKWLVVNKAETGACRRATGLYTYACISIYVFWLSVTKWFRGKQEQGSQ